MKYSIDRGERRQRITARDCGASLVEYALLLALIAAVCVVAVTILGTSTGSGMESDASSLFVD